MVDVASDSWEHQLIASCAEAFRSFHEGTSSWATFNSLLDRVLAITESEYGFVGHLQNRNGRSVLQMIAITNIAWNKNLANLVVPEGFFFSAEHGSAIPFPSSSSSSYPIFQAGFLGFIPLAKLFSSKTKIYFYFLTISSSCLIVCLKHAGGSLPY